jgi:uncharacterized protein (UPF0179 family)
MLVQISNSIILNTDQIVTVELVETPVDFTSEVRITLVGRMGHVAANRCSCGEPLEVVHLPVQ